MVSHTWNNALIVPVSISYF